MPAAFVLNWKKTAAPAHTTVSAGFCRLMVLVINTLVIPEIIIMDDVSALGNTQLDAESATNTTWMVSEVALAVARNMESVPD